MSDSGASAASDRLPWLDDEPKGSARTRLTGAPRWAPSLALAAVTVAGSAYWLGRTSGVEPLMETAGETVAAPPAATMSLPDATRAVEAEAARAPAGTKGEAADRGPPRAPAVVRHGRIVIRHLAPPPSPPAEEAAPPKVEFWPALTSAGASGRMVRIGTFSSRHAAKKGWRAVIGIYPGMKRIPAAVVPVASARNGTTYYRLQMGTTSQAHSEVLCQRMRIIGQSCIVIGLGEGNA